MTRGGGGGSESSISKKESATSADEGCDGGVFRVRILAYGIA